MDQVNVERAALLQELALKTTTLLDSLDKELDLRRWRNEIGHIRKMLAQHESLSEMLSAEPQGAAAGHNG